MASTNGNARPIWFVRERSETIESFRPARLRFSQQFATLLTFQAKRKLPIQLAQLLLLQGRRTTKPLDMADKAIELTAHGPDGNFPYDWP